MPQTIYKVKDDFKVVQSIDSIPGYLEYNCSKNVFIDFLFSMFLKKNFQL